ncbi:glucan phosphoethanolaminetransferase (alkaline phosphatase superfamily) [Lewinella aquimaris]|uniref:Glucan phosphoethanolaminetransferase (Alkaline phosphatase superfamily) n=1 Tax=Neolewinella aquimaris TaxID=1835722 RepID=A0A840E6Z2_9BACT|nr:hypothetical protein [Neolewinella aquimaris]MBB4080810.1 glucan phosphoethanolaminetransferase (alkaline phosphatase superfamily) [Neolewinella aquimaris]
MQGAIYQSSGDSIYNPPPPISSSQLPLEASFLNSYELWLLFLLISFTTIVFITLAILKYKQSIDTKTFQLGMTLLLVILAGLYIVTAGFSGEVTTALIALLSTIVGYVFGNKEST